MTTDDGKHIRCYNCDALLVKGESHDCPAFNYTDTLEDEPEGNAGWDYEKDS